MASVSTENQSILLIINPIAGRKKAQRILHKIIYSLSRSNYKTKIFYTSGKGEAINIVKENAAYVQRIICCGGDGTLNEIFTGLNMINLQIPVGYIPTGTTNDLAHSLNLPTTTKKAISTAIRGQIREHDLGSFNGEQYFSYIASFGAFTKVAYSTPQWLKNLFGHTAYVFNGILSIADIRSHSVKVVADGKEISGDFVFGSVSNSMVIAGLVKLPKSGISFTDGEFEVTLIKKPKNRKDLKAIVHGILHRKYDDRYMYFFKAKEISFTFNEGVAWTTDGEFAGTLETVHIKNLRQKAQIVMSR